MPTPTIYSSPVAEWPLLQSKTEQKFKSGLFNVSAEFIRPVGNTALPSVIETSIGGVAVWPDPTVSTGTDGFERINATGYGIWDATASEVVFGYEIFTITGTAVQIERCNNPDTWEEKTFGSGENSYKDYVLAPGCGSVNCGAIDQSTAQQLRSTSKQVILETLSIKKIGAELPPAPALKFYDTDLTQLTAITTDWFAFGQFAKVNQYVGTFSVNPFTSFIATLRQNNFGKVVETEVVYALKGPSDISFGSWIAPAVDCDPGERPPPIF